MKELSRSSRVGGANTLATSSPTLTPPAICCAKWGEGNSNPKPE
jgi:hypothetical protein